MECEDCKFYQTALDAQYREVRNLRRVIKNLVKIRKGEGGTMEIDPETGFPLDKYYLET